MADKQIFFAPSNPPRTLKWGENRIYYSNCKVYGKNYTWLKDNLNESKGNPKSADINSSWVFNNKWNPTEVLERVNKELKKIQ
jgi:hypothetical protein